MAQLANLTAAVAALEVEIQVAAAKLGEVTAQADVDALTTRVEAATAALTAVAPPT